MDIATWIIFALVGALAGFLGGLLGIGGGIITVPALVWTFRFLDIHSPFLMHVAVGTSLGAMVFTAFSSAWAHFLQKGIYWHLFYAMAPGAFFGSVFGAILADHLPSEHLKLVFGFCECLIGFYFLFPSKAPLQEEDRTLSHPFIFLLLGIGIGAISTILGVGGGIITVPVLTAFHIPIRNAISTSAALGVLIAIVGAASFLYLGLDRHPFPGSVGFLYLPAFIIIGITASLTAPLGVKKTYSWPANSLKRIFGIVLILVGLSILYP